MDTHVFDRAPRHWKRLPLWTLLRRKEATNRPDLPLLSVYRYYGVIPTASRNDNFNKPSNDLSSYRHVVPNDLVLNKMKTWQGSLGVAEYEGIVSPAYLESYSKPHLIEKKNSARAEAYASW